MHCRAIALVTLTLAATASFAQFNSVIRGTVVDENERPVQGAIVSATPIDRPIIGMVPYDTSDSNGAFAISKLEYGRYSVTARKPEDDYPDLEWAFYAGFGAKRTIVKLSPQHQIARVALHLGKKAGILKGTVSDAVTGKPLDANVEFRRVHEPGNFLSANGLTTAEFKVLIPSDVEITMIVSLDGYEDWRYTNDREPKNNSIRLLPGEVMYLDIRLQPKE
jgi:hypothetical protein